jgi:hypothetical protein
MQRARLPANVCSASLPVSRQRAQASRSPLRSRTKRSAVGPWPPRGDAGHQPTAAHGRYPLPEGRPPIHVEASPPGADPRPGLLDGVLHQLKQAERQTDGPRPVVATRAEPRRQDYRDLAAAPAQVPANGHGDRLRLDCCAGRAPHLSRAHAVAMGPPSVQCGASRTRRRSTKYAAERVLHARMRRRIRYASVCSRSRRSANIPTWKPFRVARAESTRPHHNHTVQRRPGFERTSRGYAVRGGWCL